MRKLFIVCLSLMLFLPANGSFANEKGHLLIVGGGRRPPDALKEFVALSQNGPILVITSASDIPQESGPAMVTEFRDAGANAVSWLHIDRSEMANADSMVQKIASAKAVFFTGGVQGRLMQRIGGTKSETAIKTLYFEKGGVIGGTSAGAAVMSQVMITGNELMNKESAQAFITIQAQNIETKTGLGLLEKVIIDQHFVAHKRHNRLISLVLENPKRVGIGIDEDTAIMVYPNYKFRVYGQNSVIVYDARRADAVQVNPNGLLGGRKIRLDVLTEGDVYQLDH